MKTWVSTVVVLHLLFFSCLPAFSQLPLHFMPRGVIGDAYIDTLLNSRAILVREGIKKIYCYQDRAAATKTFAEKTVLLDEEGRPVSVQVCFLKSAETGFTLCMNDTLLYDPRGRLVEIKSTDNKGNAYLKSSLEYLDGGEVKYQATGPMLADTLNDYKYFNEKGQVVKTRQVRKGQEPAETFIYYNKDGLPDSIRIAGSPIPLFVFKRKVNRKTKQVTMESYIGRFVWIYNLSGQCLSYSFLSKQASGKTAKEKMKFTDSVIFDYNADGTLSKVAQKAGEGQTATTYYSYYR